MADLLERGPGYDRAIRDATASDHARILELRNRAYPEHALTPAQFEREILALEDPFAYRFWVSEDAGGVWSALELHHSPGVYDPQRFYFNLYVHPEARGLGHGSALYAALLAHLLVLELRELHTSALEHEEVALRMLERRGFVEVKRDLEWELDLLAFDPRRFEPPETVLARSNLTLHTFADLDRGAFRRDFHAFFSETRLDIPRTVPPSPISFEFLDAHSLSDPDFLREGSFLALDGGRIAGVSSVFRGGAPGTLEVWQTSVRREYRGRGVALALKLAGIRWAQMWGYSGMRTDNDASNAAMLRVNQKLGFAALPGWVRLMKTFR